MKKKSLLYCLAVVAGLFASCTQDNVHEPEPEVITQVVEVPAEKEPFDDSRRYEGTLTSSVPAMAAMMEVKRICEPAKPHSAKSNVHSIRLPCA